MPKALKAALFLLVGVAAAAGGYWLSQVQRGGANAPFYATTLPDPAGRAQAMAQWQGKILVINFWATWCEPCREEIPGLLRIRNKYVSKNVEVVGIAVDSADKVREYAKQMNIGYPLVVGGLESIDMARRFGNQSGALPFTVILDKGGNTALTHLGLITEADLDRKLVELAR